jgi:small subunit ribosomal protein S20
MANIKSAKKRIAVNEKKNAENRTQKSKINTLVKKFKAAVAASEFALAEELYKSVASAIDTAAGTNIVHKNKANRTKAALAKQLAGAKA